MRVCTGKDNTEPGQTRKWSHGIVIEQELYQRRHVCAQSGLYLLNSASYKQDKPQPDGSAPTGDFAKVQII